MTEVDEGEWIFMVVRVKQAGVSMFYRRCLYLRFAWYLALMMISP